MSVRKFTAWVSMGVLSEKEEFDVDDTGLTEKGVEEACDEYVQIMIANAVDAGWNEIT